MDCFRCGFCGQPCSKEGVPLKLWQIAVLNPFVDWDNPTGQVYGLCCAYKEHESRYYEVTREMAIDAGCPEMEGTLVER